MTDDKLINTDEYERQLKKARLESALGYITYLAEIRKKLKNLDELADILDNDANSISGTLGPILQEELKSDGYGCGLMDSLNIVKAKRPVE